MLRRGVHACPTGCSIGNLVDGGFQPSTRKSPTQRSAGCPAGNAADSADDTFDKPVSKTPVPARRPLRREALCLLANEVRPLAAEATREATPRIEYPAPAGVYGRMRRTRMMGSADVPDFRITPALTRGLGARTAQKVQRTRSSPLPAFRERMAPCPPAENAHADSTTPSLPASIAWRSI